MRLEGTTTLYGTEVPILTDVFYTQDGTVDRDSAKVEIRNFTGGTDPFRTGADGVSLWNYDFARN